VRLDGVERRGFLLGAAALLATGCARVPPSGVTPPSSATPTPTVAPLTLGKDETLAGAVFAQVLASALAASGRRAAVTQTQDGWRAALGHGDLAAVPGYARTLWSVLSAKGEPPAADDLLPDLAALLEPDIGLLRVPGVDASLVWLVTARTAGQGIGSLSRLSGWSRGRRAAIPPIARSRDDGVPALRGVYHAQFTYDDVADPVERAALLTRGDVAAAAFRRTEYTGAASLVALVDTEEVAQPDPGVVLVSQKLSDAEPDRVLLLNDVAQALTTDVLVELQAHVVAGGSVDEVAVGWLKEQGFA
jgi:glycine betaine/choline ABC-type transport system substrate-binding protein